MKAVVVFAIFGMLSASALVTALLWCAVHFLAH
jgi:hypothetical protein